MQCMSLAPAGKGLRAAAQFFTAWPTDRAGLPEAALVHSGCSLEHLDVAAAGVEDQAQHVLSCQLALAGCLQCSAMSATLDCSCVHWQQRKAAAGSPVVQ